MGRALALALLLLVTACSPAAQYDDTAALAAGVGCASSYELTGQSQVPAEVGSCEVSGERFTLLVAKDADDLRRSTDALGLVAYEQGTAEAYVAGETWAVMVRTREQAEQLQEQLGGLVRGI